MTTSSKDGRQEDPPPRASLALLQIPHVFSQDELLTTGEFIKRAKERGYDVDLALLQRIHERNLMVPLFRIDDTPEEGRRIDVVGYDGANARGWVLLAAAEGRLHDPADEDYSIEWPYQMPAEVQPDRWWNGFIYSSWQLFDLRHVIHADRAITAGWQAGPRLSQTVRDRRLTLVLAALATPYLPRVLGRVRFPPGVSDSELRLVRAEADTEELLRLAGYPGAELSQAADNLLLSAHSDDPMDKWLKLLRYSRYSGWSKMRGEPLDCMWRRVAAEVLLGAHEDLAAAGVLDPLPDLSGSTWHAPQHDRLTPRYAEAETLERALAEFGLSPHPRVILLVEGKTEHLHMRRLLNELGLSQPRDVRVQACHGSKVNAHLIARYGITPRIGRRLRNSWLLDASPTALVLAMDPENRFATTEKCAAERRNLQAAIREEVRYQDADISQDDLDILVSVHVWGQDKYELANFTDDELVPAIAQLANTHGNANAGSPRWEAELRGYLSETRRLHLDIEAPLGQINAPKDKVALADILWPVLRSKCERELSADSVVTPVLRLVMEVHQLVAKLSGVFGLEMPPGAARGE